MSYPFLTKDKLARYIVVILQSVSLVLISGCNQQVTQGLPSDCAEWKKELILPMFHFGIHGTDSQHLWLVGRGSPYGDGVIRFYDGNGWSTQWFNDDIYFNKIFAFSQQHVFAVGKQGAIAATTDGGLTWILQPTPTTDTLSEVVATSTSSAWAVGGNGTLLGTTTAGQSWTSLTSNTSANLYGIDAGGATTLWAVGEAGTIIKTTNGADWTTQVSGTTEGLFKVLALSETEAWVVGDTGTLLHTSDGGMTWQAVQSPVTQSLRNISQDPQGDLWVVGDNGTVLHHQAGTLTAIDVGVDVNLSDVFVTNTNHAWLISANVGNFIMRGNIISNTWSFISEPIPFSSSTIADVRAEGQEVFRVGTPAAVYRSRDGGKTWKVLHSEDDATLRELETANFHIWAAGWGGGGPNPGLVLHYDRNQWIRHDNLAGVLLGAVGVGSESHVWAVGAQGTILYTDDGGSNWMTQQPPPSAQNATFLDVAAASPSEAWIVGVGGVILRTTTGGQTWTAENVLTTQDLRSVSISGNEVWIVGKQGTILRFDGTDWTDYSWVTSKQLNDVEATREAGVWIAGVDGTLLLFDGATWFNLPSGEPSYPFRKVSGTRTVKELIAYVDASFAPQVFRVFRYGCCAPVCE
jgi:photosystem II stability/assembly factor-like uncharacterized protein